MFIKVEFYRLVYFPVAYYRNSADLHGHFSQATLPGPVLLYNVGFGTDACEALQTLSPL